MASSDFPTFTEQHRPQVHFSAPENWLNDPNGLVFLNGKYHLFYQHNAQGMIWGNMCWGHASSEDLIHWQHHPIAIDKGGNIDDFIFSGSAVYDENNCSGLGSETTPPLLAFFTWSGEKSENQRQAVAYSLDEGMTWKLYQGNPVIANPSIKDFRDPKVFWHEEKQHWVMLVAAGQHIKLYRSDNLLDWQYQSHFGDHIGMHGGDWECPDLFRLTVDDSEQQKWVMIVSVSPGAPNGGCATQYFIGEFDGINFIPDQPNSQWIDWGPDSFAGITWNRTKENPDKIYLAWMGNWLYANKTPTFPWRGQMTLPRKLTLRRTQKGLKLCSVPYNIVKQLRQKELRYDLTTTAKVPEVHEGVLDVTIGHHSTLTETDTLAGLKFSNDANEHVLILIDSANKRLIIDRHNTINTTDFPQYAFSYYANLPESNNQHYQIHWVKDCSSIELFINDGETVMTALLYSENPLTSLKWINLSGQTEVEQALIYPLNALSHTQSHSQ